MGNKKFKLDGPKLNVPNKNGRIYPDSPFKAALTKYQESIDVEQSFGELGHSENPNISVKNLSHLVTSAKIKTSIYLENLRRSLRRQISG